jgi:membrane glycosyltransferase
MFDRLKARISSKSPSPPTSPISKLEQAISTWDREQARIALAIFAATVFKDRAPIESIFGRTAKVETAIRRLTGGQLRVLYSILTEIAPDYGDGENEDD